MIEPIQTSDNKQHKKAKTSKWIIFFYLVQVLMCILMTSVLLLNIYAFADTTGVIITLIFCFVIFLSNKLCNSTKND